MTIKCTTAEQELLKRSIKACECKLFCAYKPLCNKPEDMTCGEYIIKMITWELEDEE